MDIICCARKTFTDYASRYGWLAGSRSDHIRTNGYTADDKIHFIDAPFKDFDKHEREYWDAIEYYKPIYAVAPDIYTWNEFPTKIKQAYRLFKLGAERVIVVPKVRGMNTKVPTDFIIGWPMASKAYADVVMDEWELFSVQGRPIHLLGATPNRQVVIMKYHNVISLDGNAFIKVAHRYRKAYGSNLESIDMRGKNIHSSEIVFKSIDGIAAFWENQI